MINTAIVAAITVTVTVVLTTLGGYADRAVLVPGQGSALHGHPGDPHGAAQRRC